MERQQKHFFHGRRIGQCHYIVCKSGSRIQLNQAESHQGDNKIVGELLSPELHGRVDEVVYNPHLYGREGDGVTKHCVADTAQLIVMTPTPSAGRVSRSQMWKLFGESALVQSMPSQDRRLT